jgi:hypothetical protein
VVVEVVVEELLPVVMVVQVVEERLEYILGKSKI